MNYIELKIFTTGEGIDYITEILMNLGIDSIVVEDAADFKDLLEKKNSYDWDYIDESLMELSSVETNITAYIEDNEDGSLLIKSIKEEIAKLAADDKELLFGRLILTEKSVSDSDWKDNWKEYFKPGSITDKFAIKPTWMEYEKRTPDELVIEIDPGMAFGTGKHPTTTLCIKLLEKYIRADEDSVLDIGCGSGILSIAAAMLGAKHVKGVEIDPIAVEVAKENIAINGLTQKAEVVLGDLTNGLNEKADIVVANLMADLVMSLSGDVAKHLKGRKIYISSGILIDRQDQVVSAIENCGFEILEILEEDEWCAIAAKLPE